MTNQVEKTGNNEVALFQYLEEKGCIWANLSYKKGQFYLRFKDKKRLYHYAYGVDMAELMENLEERILRLSA